MKFEELGLSNQLCQTVNELGFKEATLVQEKTIPAALKGQDVVGQSATGSGKTFAFGAPIIEKVEQKGYIQAIVLTPTRELAQQVHDEFIKFSAHKMFRLTTIYGGVSMNPQIHELGKADIVVGTPGRVLDHLRRGNMNLSKIKFLVLDEADRMLEMGFIEDVEQIMQACPKSKQTLFFSATMSDEILHLTQSYMNDPLTVSATKQVDPTKLKQVYYDIEKKGKLSLLVHLLQNENTDLAMVFCNTRSTVDFVVKNLKHNKVNAIAIHGGLSQNKRSNVLELFNSGKRGVLVCTDVAARGLHIDNVSHVYNYDLPNDPKEYVHRSGRTARAGEEGIVINLVCEFDHDNFNRIFREFRDLKVDQVETPRTERIMIVKNDRRDSPRGPRRGSHRNHNGGGNFRSSGNFRGKPRPRRN